MGTQASSLSNIKSMKVIAPGYTTHAPEALATFKRVDLKPHLGKERSANLYMNKNYRTVYAKFYDASRSGTKRCDKSLGVKVPDDIHTAEAALQWFELNHLEKYLQFQADCNRIEDENYWPASPNTDHTKKRDVHRSYPMGTVGYAWRWYEKQAENPDVLPDGTLMKKVGSPDQVDKCRRDVNAALTLKVKGSEELGHVDAEDLTPEMVNEALSEWMETRGRAISTFRGVLVMLSTVLGYALDETEETGVRRGPRWGQERGGGRKSPGLNSDAPTVINPFNTLRLRIDALKQAKRKLDLDELVCDPFSLEELRKILEAFRSTPELKHYYPLVAMISTTGCRPTEACALPWSHVTGLWKGNRVGSVGVQRAAEPRLTGWPVRYARSVHKPNAGHSDPSMRFKQTKTGAIKNPKVMDLIPGFEDAFEQGIRRLHPVGGDGSFAFMDLKEWRARLVFQGPGAGDDDFQRPFNWHNFSKRQWGKACEIAGVRYRRPYNMRHSYVTNMIEVGRERITDVARWIGDNEKVVKEHYKGVCDIEAAEERDLRADSMPKGAPDLSQMSADDLKELVGLVMNEIASR